MRMRASIFAVIATHPDGRTERLMDCETREEAEDRAQAERDYTAGEETFEVRLLDRRVPVAIAAAPPDAEPDRNLWDQSHCTRCGGPFMWIGGQTECPRCRPQPRPIPEGVLILLQGATAAERTRCLEIYR